VLTNEHACAVLRRFEIEPSALDRLMDNYFREHRELSGKNRRIIADLSFGVMRWLRRIDNFLQRTGNLTPAWSDRVELYAQWLAENAGLPLDDTAKAKLPPEILHSYPDFLYAKLVRTYGEAGASEIASALNRPSTVTVRVNTAKIGREEVLAAFDRSGVKAEITKHSPYGVRVQTRFALSDFEFYKKGFLEIQDEASQLSCLLAAVPGPAKILDACAGAGGKSLMLATICGSGTRITAADTDKRKLSVLNKRARRAGISNIECVSTGALLNNEFGVGTFDVVLIDAPCSGTGTIRRNPDLKWRVSSESIEEASDTQLEILKRYATFLAPSGKLVYITCSLLAEENEDVVGRFLEDSCLCIEKIPKDYSDLLAPAVAFFGENGFFFTHPARESWDGFKACILKS